MTAKAKHSVTQSWLDTSDQLLGFIISKVQNREDAEDILQDVFVKTIDKVDSLAKDTNLNAWMYVVTRNAINDYFRQKSRMYVKDEVIQEIPEPETENHQDDFCCLEPHINELPDKYRQVIYLSEMKGLKHKVIAEKLNISLSAIKSRVVRGRELLKEMFVSCCHYHLNGEGKLVGSPDCQRPDCNH